MIDAAAIEIALRRYGLPECLHVPIAAMDEQAISNFVGEIVQDLSGRSARRALLVRAGDPPPRDLSLPIWDVSGCDILHQRMQVWVDVKYGSYRSAYKKAFPGTNIANFVLSHAMNRRVATLKGFRFVRLTPTSRGANSSSAFSEEWGVSLHGRPDQMAANRRRGAFIQYADLTDLMLMLDLKLGGGVMELVNEGQKLVRPRT